MHYDAMAIFWLKERWFKRHGSSQFRAIDDDYNLLKEVVVVRSAVEKGETSFGGKGKLCDIKLDNANYTLDEA